MKQVGRQILLGGLGAGRLAIYPETIFATEMPRFETSRLAFVRTNAEVRSTSLIRPAGCCTPCRRWGKTGKTTVGVCHVRITPGSGRQTRQPASAKGRAPQQCGPAYAPSRRRMVARSKYTFSQIKRRHWRQKSRRSGPPLLCPPSQSR